MLPAFPYLDSQIQLVDYADGVGWVATLPPLEDCPNDARTYSDDARYESREVATAAAMQWLRAAGCVYAIEQMLDVAFKHRALSHDEYKILSHFACKSVYQIARSQSLES